MVKVKRRSSIMDWYQEQSAASKNVVFENEEICRKEIVTRRISLKIAHYRIITES